MRRFETWQKEIKTFLGETIHAQINVTMETDNDDANWVKISVRGNRSPFAFRDTTMPKEDANNISELLHKDAWKRTSYSYVN